MPIPSFDVIASAVVSGAAACACLYLVWGRRLNALERELRGHGEAICQLADNQMEQQRKISGSMQEMEEKILDLTVPSRGAGLSLDRRHRVLSLARRGLGVDEIARQLKVTRGEAELILSLKKYMQKDAPQPAPAAGEA